MMECFVKLLVAVSVGSISSVGLESLTSYVSTCYVLRLGRLRIANQKSDTRLLATIS